MTTRIITFLVGDPDQKTFICHCYCEGATSKVYFFSDGFFWCSNSRVGNRDLQFAWRSCGVSMKITKNPDIWASYKEVMGNPPKIPLYSGENWDMPWRFDLNFSAVWHSIQVKIGSKLFFFSSLPRLSNPDCFERRWPSVCMGRCSGAVRLVTGGRGCWELWWWRSLIFQVLRNL